MVMLIIGILFGLYNIQFITKSSTSAFLAVFTLGVLAISTACLVVNHNVRGESQTATIKGFIKSEMRPLPLAIIEIVLAIVFILTQYCCDNFEEIDIRFKEEWNSGEEDFMSLNSVWVPVPLKETFILMYDIENTVRSIDVDSITEEQYLELERYANDKKEDMLSLINELMVGCVMLSMLLLVAVLKHAYELISYLFKKVFRAR